MDIKNGKNGYYFNNNNTNYKKVYRHFSGMEFDDSLIKKTNYEKNIILIEGILDIFGFNQKTDFIDIKRKISPNHIKELYKLIAWLWPPDIKIEEFLPKPSNNLRALYIGNMRPQTILQSVGRYSLYTDEILVMNPFLNPWQIRSKYNPLICPEKHIQDTWKWVLFILKLSPWIIDKQVCLLPDPLNFDISLRDNIFNLAKIRMSEHEEEFKSYFSTHRKDFSDDFDEILRDMYMNMSNDGIRSRIKEINPSTSNRQIDDLILYIQKKKKNDPYFIESLSKNELIVSRTGANLELGLYISQLTGSYLYTDIEWKWKEILSAKNEIKDNKDSWDSLSYAFKELDFKFLDGIDLEFIHNMKKDNRLSSLRNYLRKTWSAISDNKKQDYKNIHSNVRDFIDELKEETSKAEYEWKDIDNKLKKWLLSRTGIGSLIIANGGMDWAITGAGFALDGINHLLQANYERKKFRSSVPLSVFIDLKSK